MAALDTAIAALRRVQRALLGDAAWPVPQPRRPLRQLQTVLGGLVLALRGPGPQRNPWISSQHLLATRHPEVADVLCRLIADSAHPLDVVRALADPGRREGTFRLIVDLADDLVLAGRTLEMYRQDSPGVGPLFDPVPWAVNHAADGTSRRENYLRWSAGVEPIRDVGPPIGPASSALLTAYADRLADEVEPAVQAEVAALAAPFPGVQVSSRAKTADAIEDKVARMVRGGPGRTPRPDTRVGDVIDAVGARITVADTGQLNTLIGRVVDHFGPGDGGRILQMQNMYAHPKLHNPAYRVVSAVVAVELGGRPYTFELQLSTRRASVAADLEHNTIYKPYLPLSDAERERIRRMLAEAAAADQEETRWRT